MAKHHCYNDCNCNNNDRVSNNSNATCYHDSIENKSNSLKSFTEGNNLSPLSCESFLDDKGNNANLDFVSPLYSSREEKIGQPQEEKEEERDDNREEKCWQQQKQPLASRCRQENKRCNDQVMLEYPPLISSSSSWGYFVDYTANDEDINKNKEIQELNLDELCQRIELNGSDYGHFVDYGDDYVYDDMKTIKMTTSSMKNPIVE